MAQKKAFRSTYDIRITAEREINAGNRPSRDFTKFAWRKIKLSDKSEGGFDDLIGNLTN